MGLDAKVDSAKWSPFFVSVIRSAVSEISQSYVFYAKSCELQYLGIGTSDHRSENQRPLCRVNSGIQTHRSAIESTPQNLGKLTSETTFGYS